MENSSPAHPTEEQEAAAELREWIRERKVQAFEYGAQLARIEEGMLKHYGHKTREAALMSVFAVALREIERRIAAHEAKYPH